MDKIACLDIDGVLADFESAFAERFGWERRDLVELEERYPSKSYEIDLFVNSTRTYENLNIVQLGVDIANFLCRKGFDIHIVSSRPSYTSQISGLWLKQNKIPFHYLSVGITHKVGYYMSLHPSIVVEDMVDIAIGVGRFGVHSFLINQPWNENKWENGSVKRIRKFNEFLEEYYQFSETLMEF